MGRCIKIAYVNAKGIKKKSIVQGITANDYLKKLFPSSLLTMKMYLAERLAVIECNTYSGNLDRIKQKLDSFFTIIKEQKNQHAALDLRRNGGWQFLYW